MKATKQYTAEEKFLIIREATHKGVVAPPQENGHVESFHSIVARLLKR